MSRQRSPLPPLLPLAALVAAAALTACADATAPGSPAAPAPNALVFNLGYSATILPLVPAGINDSGVILGNGLRDAFRYYNGVATILPRAAGQTGAHVGTAINRAGAMGGYVNGGPGLYWRAVTQTPYVIPAPANSEQVRVYAINNNATIGMAVGTFLFLATEDGISANHAFRWTTAGGLVDITPAGYRDAFAVDVNDAGYVVGFGWKPGGVVTALRWRPDNSVVELQQGAQANVVGADGAALGMADGFTTTRYWTLFGGSGALSTPQNSSVDDASANGRIVGYTYKHGTPSHRPWTVFNGTTIWLPVPDASFSEVVANLRVNACGSIVATQTLTEGIQRGILYTKSMCDLSGITTGGTTTAAAAP